MLNYIIIIIDYSTISLWLLKLEDVALACLKTLNSIFVVCGAEGNDKNTATNIAGL